VADTRGGIDQRDAAIRAGLVAPKIDGHAIGKFWVGLTFRLAARVDPIDRVAVHDPPPNFKALSTNATLFSSLKTSTESPAHIGFCWTNQ
jgi:hypothetical protein